MQDLSKCDENEVTGKKIMLNFRSLHAEIFMPVFVLVGFVIAAIVSIFNFSISANQVLAVVLIIGFLPFVKDMVLSILRGHFGIDLIAVVGIGASILIHEYLAGCMILLMLSGGEALEVYARRRARKELTQLLSRVPTKAHLKKEGSISEVKVEQVEVGDVIVVKQGEIVPVDGLVVHGSSMLDESALTGESLPVEKTIHQKVMSGSINMEGVLEIRTLKISKDSKYAQIVRLVREAEEQKAPFVRMADRYSVFFTIVAFLLAGIAWLISKDPIRALAVLVVATPCPLILATPIAFTSGMSRAALRGIIIKSGEAMEKLAQAKTFLFDKTGTITLGVPKMLKVISFSKLDKQEVERLAASLDQLSAHVLASSLVASAQSQKLELDYPKKFVEHLGHGVEGEIADKKYVFGNLQYLSSAHVLVDAQIEKKHEELRLEGVIPVYLAQGKQLLGVIYFADQVRANVRHQFALLSVFVDRLIMVTGDREQVARNIAAQVGIKDIRFERLPEQKLADVKELQKVSGPVVMVGDGINDAPALAASDVGIVLGSGATTAAHEAGDIVITVDQFSRIVEAFRISKHVLKVAKQGIIIGIGLSILLMLMAMLGYIRPFIGAFLQEIIDVLVILNALRVHQGVSSVALPMREDHR